MGATSHTAPGSLDTPRDRQTDYMPMCQGRPAPHARDQSLSWASDPTGSEVGSGHTGVCDPAGRRLQWSAASCPLPTPIPQASGCGPSSADPLPPLPALPSDLPRPTDQRSSKISSRRILGPKSKDDLLGGELLITRVYPNLHHHLSFGSWICAGGESY
jgi:hypothetical protein